MFSCLGSEFGFGVPRVGGGVAASGTGVQSFGSDLRGWNSEFGAALWELRGDTLRSLGDRHRNMSFVREFRSAAPELALEIRQCIPEFLSRASVLRRWVVQFQS